MPVRKPISNPAISPAPAVVKPLFFQPKLAINQPNDAYEREADRIADQVVQTPGPATPFRVNNPAPAISPLQRKCADCEQEEEAGVMRKAQPEDTFAGQIAPPAVQKALPATGRPLPENTRNFMESGFGRDFSGVRVHTGAEAAASARAIQAKAYTSGSDIVFDQGEFAPDTAGGRRLLAHELTHVLQQNAGLPTPAVQRDGPGGGLIDPFEETADIDLVNPYVLSPEATGAVRERVLEPMRRHDATGFTTRLRGVNATEALALLDDGPFWTEIRRVFRGRSLWTVFTILFFNNRQFEPHIRVHRGLFDRDAALLMDAIAMVIADGEVTSDQYFDMLWEVVMYEFLDHPLLPRILRMIAGRHGDNRARNLRFSSGEVHYERNVDGTYRLEDYSPSPTMTAYVNGDSFRVIVRIRFLDGLRPAEPYYFLADGERGIPDRWKRIIESTWNGQFALNNGRQRLRFTVSPMFLFASGRADHEVRILNNRRAQTCPTVTTPGRATSACWFTSSEDNTIKHEFGHMLGAADEYNLPGSEAEVPAEMRSRLSAEELALTTVEGITGTARPAVAGGHSLPGLMGDRSSSTAVFARHIRLLVRAFNATLPAGTPAFTIEDL